MLPETFAAALLFSLAMAFTPGPNNIMLAASGARFGIRPSLPHMWGVSLGFPLMVLLVGLGLASILLAAPLLQLAMKIASCVYLLWLAFQIARSRTMSDGRDSGRPMSFLQAAAFQWVNPKAWLIAVGAISAYTAGRGAQLYLQVAILASISLGVTIVSTATWMGFGAGIRRWLKHPKALRAFNVTMALLLVASTVPILLEIRDALR
jgi:threonine/homoserine/homoserine lactone efflux protein